MLINKKFVLCRYYGNRENVFADGEISNNSLTIKVEISKEGLSEPELTTIYFDEKNTRKLFNIVKVRDFESRFCGVEGLKVFEQFCKDNKIESKIKSDE